MRVLYVDSCPHWGHGGAQISLLGLATALDQTRFEPLFLGIRGGSLMTRVAAADIETFGIHGWAIAGPGLHAPWKHLLRSLRARPFLEQWLRPRGLDLIHINSEGAASTLGHAATRLGIPFVLHIRDMDRNWFGGRERRAARRASAVIVASRAMRQYVENAGIDPGLIRVIPNGVDPAPFETARARRDATRAALSIGPEDFAVGIVGTIIPRKGHLDLVRAAASSAILQTKIRFFVAGRDPHQGEPHLRALHREIQEHGVSSRFEFLGWSDQVADRMAAFDLTAAPFRKEAFGRVIIESMLAGTPVVAYHSDALPELIRNGQDGLLVAPGSPDALARGLAELYMDRGRLTDMRRNGLERSIVATSGGVYLALGKPRLNAQVSAFRAFVLLALVVPMALRFGLVGVAWTVFVSSVTMIPFALAYVRRLLDVTLGELLWPIASGASLAAVTAVPLAVWRLRAELVGPTVVLPAVLAVLAYSGAAWVYHRAWRIGPLGLVAALAEGAHALPGAAGAP